MKNFLPILFLLVSASLFADEIKFYGAKWNDLADVLGIKPFYLEVQSGKKAKNILLEVDLYKNGQLVRQIVHSDLSTSKSEPIDFKCAMYFVPKSSPSEGYDLKWKMTLGKISSSSSDAIPISEADFQDACFSFSLNQPLSNQKKTPVFVIGLGKYPVGANTVEDVIKGNPNATLFVGYLEMDSIH